MATRYLINPSGVMIRPKNKAHMMELLNKGGGWATDPETGEPTQRGKGFRPATDEEVAAHEAKWAADSNRMQQQELRAKKANAQLVMMAPDEALLDSIIERREAAKAAAESAKPKRAKKEAEDA